MYPVWPVILLGSLSLFSSLLISQFLQGSLPWLPGGPSPTAHSWKEKYWMFTPARPHSKLRGGVSDLPTLSSPLLPLLKETISLLRKASMVLPAGVPFGYWVWIGRYCAFVCVCMCTTSVVMGTVQNTLQDPSGWVGQWTLFHLISHNAANSVACWSGERRRVKSWPWVGMNP